MDRAGPTGSTGRRSSPTRALLRRERIEIVFQGLDTFAEVSVNGARVLSADNMFRAWRADIKPHVVAGSNAVVVHFRSPIAVAKPAYDRLGYTLPAANDQAPEMVSMFARKAPYHYGWDWGPRFVTSGIWRPAAIEAWDEARLDDVQVYQRALDDARARLEVAAVVTAARAGRARVTVGLPGGRGAGGGRQGAGARAQRGPPGDRHRQAGALVAERPRRAEALHAGDVAGGRAA